MTKRKWGPNERKAFMSYDIKVILTGLVSVGLFILASLELAKIENTFTIAALYFGSFFVTIFFGMAVATNYWTSLQERK